MLCHFLFDIAKNFGTGSLEYFSRNIRRPALIPHRSGTLQKLFQKGSQTQKSENLSFIQDLLAETLQNQRLNYEKKIEKISYKNR